jgi:hypothetical protein
VDMAAQEAAVKPKPAQVILAGPPSTNRHGRDVVFTRPAVELTGVHSGGEADVPALLLIASGMAIYRRDAGAVLQLAEHDVLQRKLTL